MGGFFSTLKGKRVAFIGAGVSHRELIPMFARAGAAVTLCDRKNLAELGQLGQQLLDEGIRLVLGENYLDGLAGQNMILRTPGFEYYTEQLQQALRAGTDVTSEMELFFEYCPAKTVGVTGSDGKTTTTTLIAEMYRAEGRTVHLGGNIGRPLLPIVDEIAKDDVAVVELSSFQLISMHASPDIAVVTNVTPNHLDHHKDMDEYINAKRNILAYQNKQGIAVLGYENLIARGMQKDAMGEVRFFSRLREVPNGAYLDESGVLYLASYDSRQPVVAHGEVLLPGEHNIENMLAAFAAVRGEVSVASMQKVARSFKGVPHRIEPVRVLNGVHWYNDSIATSPTRVVAGLRAFNQKLIVIAGGYDKNLPYTPMATDVVQRVKLLILMGQTSAKIEGAVRAAPGFEQSGLEILRAENMEQAVQLAYRHARSGDIVTLSPASASFDVYSNFEERGNHYKQLVNAL